MWIRLLAPGPLMQAIQAGDAAAVEVVLAGDFDVNESTRHGTTPLMSAAHLAIGHNAAAAQTRCCSHIIKERWITGVSARSILLVTKMLFVVVSFRCRRKSD